MTRDNIVIPPGRDGAPGFTVTGEPVQDVLCWGVVRGPVHSQGRMSCASLYHMHSQTRPFIRPRLSLQTLLTCSASCIPVSHKRVPTPYVAKLGFVR